MRIVCPNCHATFEVPDALLRPGRAVRCARCAEDWVPAASEAVARPVAETPVDEAAGDEAPIADSIAGLGDVSAADPAPLPGLEPAAPTAFARPSAVSEAVAHPRWRDDRLALAGWAASVVVLILLAWGGLAGRDAVMRAWPPSTRLYGAIGLLPK